MNIEQILSEYDSMFGRFPLEDIEKFLRKYIDEARKQGELQLLVTLLNEMIGFCRDTTQKEKALKYCDELKLRLKEMDLEDSVPYATSLLNIANAYRAFGLCEEALKLYQNVLDIYEKYIPENDFSYASLYNNWALVYQETEDYVKAAEFLFKALQIVDLYPDAKIPQATTRTNLGTSLIGVGTQKTYETAMVYIQQALDIFEQDGGQDFHYGAALVAMGDACNYTKNYKKACDYYQSGLDELEKHTGKTKNYERVLEKYNQALSKCELNNEWKSNLEQSREFYEKVGKPMILKDFPEYADRIAVGLVGEGSDCFGFDDEISADHDYEVGFCMWLIEEDYERIGSKLQQSYEKLTDTTSRLQYRRGVFSINGFYRYLLNRNINFESDIKFSFEDMDIEKLATATNGQIFEDSLGIFSKIRERLINEYPVHLWKRRLAQSIHEFSQYAQSNYSRMMSRKDAVTAMMCVGKAVEIVLDLMYLLEHKYAPYYKWKKKGIENTRLAKTIFPLLEEIAKLPNQSNVWEGYRYSSASVHTEDANVSIFEKIAAELLAEMKRQNLVDGQDLFLEAYVKQILDGKNMDMIEKIVLEEWSQFDLVKNEGGRADCQDDFETFSLMRKSQYMTWNRELLESFYQDLCAAKKNGWNLIMEKYARMMKSTNPIQYAALEQELPIISNERQTIQEEIIKIQVSWMEAFAEDYPKMSANARSIRTDEDSAFNTSYETYLRGEIGTYSENTFVLYVNFIIGLLKEGRNLAYDTMGNTAKLYGYASLDDAEKKLY